LLKTRLEPFLKAVFMSGSGSAGDNAAMPRSARTDLTACRQAWQLAPWCVLVAALIGGGAAPLAHAGSKDDHERARAAVQSGEVLPLPLVLERLQRSHPGQVLELELERDKGLWIYEIRLMQADGQLLKLKVDAATARVLESRRR
jgi:hypothetical protein